MVEYMDNSDGSVQRINTPTDLGDIFGDDEKVLPEPIDTSLADYMTKIFDQAVNDRDTVSTLNSVSLTERLARCRRQVSGEYDEDVAAKIRETKGADLFFNITAVKHKALLAWLSDIYAELKNYPTRALKPSPIPELPASEKAEAQNEVLEVITMTDAVNPLDPAEREQAQKDIYDARLLSLQNEATERALRMARKIEDQFHEGGFVEAFLEFLHDFSIYPFAVLKGPVVQNRKRIQWVGNKVEVKNELVPTWKRVSPFDFYWSNNTRNTCEGYLFERIVVDPRVLCEQKGAPGWNDKQIDELLRRRADGGAYPNNIAESQGEDERRRLEGKDTVATTSGRKDDMPTGFEAWGAVTGKMLKDWGFKGEVEDSKYYDCCVIVLDGLAVKAILNPNPVGNRYYYTSAFDPIPGSIAGIALPESMRDCQQLANAAGRGAANSIAWASRHQTVVDVDALAEGFDPQTDYPGRKWLIASRQLQNQGATLREPIYFFQPKDNSRTLMALSEWAESKADDRTSIPRFAHGNANVGGAGQTMGGLMELMEMAHKGLKRIVGNIDRDIYGPAINDIYIWNMLFLPDEKWAEIKGDCQVVTPSSLAVIIRERVQKKRLEWLQIIASNEIDSRLFGPKERAKFHRELMSDLDFDTSIVPSDEEIDSRFGTMEAPEPQYGPDGQPIDPAQSMANMPPEPKDQAKIEKDLAQAQKYAAEAQNIKASTVTNVAQQMPVGSPA